jgi:hypothetical protein
MKRALLGALLLLRTGCSAWRPLSEPPHAEVGVVRVTRTDGTRLVLDRSRVEGDSLRSGTVAIALVDVERLEARRRASPVVSVLATLAIFGVALGAVSGMPRWQ